MAPDLISESIGINPGRPHLDPHLAWTGFGNLNFRHMQHVRITERIEHDRFHFRTSQFGWLRHARRPRSAHADRNPRSTAALWTCVPPSRPHWGRRQANSGHRNVNPAHHSDVTRHNNAVDLPPPTVRLVAHRRAGTSQCDDGCQRVCTATASCDHSLPGPARRDGFGRRFDRALAGTVAGRRFGVCSPRCLIVLARVARRSCIVMPWRSSRIRVACCSLPPARICTTCSMTSRCRHFTATAPGGATTYTLSTYRWTASAPTVPRSTRNGARSSCYARHWNPIRSRCG